MKKVELEKTSRIFVFGMALLFSTIALTPSSSQAADWYFGTRWIGDSANSNLNGDWNVGTYWTPTGVPTSGDGVSIGALNGVGAVVHFVNNQSDRTIPYLEYLNGLMIDGGGATLNQTQDTLTMGNASDPYSNPYTYVGYSDIGTFNQSGGTHVSPTMFLGYDVGSTGTYTLSGGRDTSALTTNTAIFGLYGQGNFTQTGGTHTVNKFLELGAMPTGIGTYRLQGGLLTTSTPPGANYPSTIVGESGTGFFTQAGGIHDVMHQLILGRAPGGSGTYELQAGNLNTYGDTYVSREGTGTFINSGGTHTADGTVWLGSQPGITGIYRLSAGLLTANLGVVVGQVGDGIFDQTGGIHEVGPSAALTIGNNTGSSGIYNLSDTGQLTAGNVYVSAGGRGQFNQTGGSNNSNNVVIGVNPGDIGNYNLSGGALTVLGSIVNNGEFHYSGGTLKAGQFLNNAGGAFRVSGPAEQIVQADVTTAGGSTTTIDATTAVFTGTFSLDGAFYSDPSTIRFMNTLTVASTGFISASPGDIYEVSADFLNYSTNDSWDTNAADLFFTGAGPHRFHLSSLAAANTWDELTLLNGTTLDLSSDAAATLFVRLLNGDIGNITNTGLYPLTINYGGGELVLAPVPEPETYAMLLAGLGLLGFAARCRKRKDLWRALELPGAQLPGKSTYFRHQGPDSPTMG